MGFFKDSLNNWFFQNNSKAAGSGTLVPLLDENGTAIGCDKIGRIMAYGFGDDDFVDLGLPSGTLWAKCNVGAVNPEDDGWYFSWGNLEGHKANSGYDFSQEVYNNTSGKNITADLTVLQDAARANWGGRWKIPTKEQTKELCDNCTSTWIDDSGVTGRLFVSTVNGDSIFFPASGLFSGTTLAYHGTNGFVWCSSLDSATNAYNFGFDSTNSPSPQRSSVRNIGLSIRPVL